MSEVFGKAIILDTETTDLPHKGGEACEIAYFEVHGVAIVSDLKKGFEIDRLLKNTHFFTKAYFHQTFMPKGEFSPQASAVNGFTKENLAGSPCISTFQFPEDIEYMIGHNINFDWQILKKPKVKLICTKELAIKYLTKERGKGTKGVNTLTGLIERYYPDEAKKLISNAHSALQDCKLCYLILLKILEAAPHLDSFEKLAGECKQPLAKLPFGILQDGYTKSYICNFGKHKGRLLKEILYAEKSYLTWIVEKSTMSKELKEFVKQFMIDNK